MTGVVGALVALAVVVALVLVLARPPARAAADPERGGAARGHRGRARTAAGDPVRAVSNRRPPTCGGRSPPPLGATDTTARRRPRRRLGD